MATTTSNGGSDLRTPGKIFDERVKALKDDKAASKSRRDGSTSKILGWHLAREYKQCTLSATKDTWAFYRDIDNFEFFDMQKSVDLMVKNIDGYAKADDQLGKLIKDASKTLNDLKAKLLDANNAACAMRNCLQSIIGFDDNKLPDELTEVTTLAHELNEESRAAAEAVATIAGIHTFANLNSLKPYGASLAAVMKDLKATSDGLIKRAEDDVKTAQTDETKVIDELNQEEFKSFEETSVYLGISHMIGFICEGTCESIKQIEDICKAVSQSDDVPAAQQETARSPKYTGGDAN